jgi:hypothetical protein
LRCGIAGYLAGLSGRTAGDIGALDDLGLGRMLLRFAGHALHVSCWQESDDESAVMWDSYVPGGNGVAVRTTFGALRAVLDAGSGDREVFLGRVSYLDYRADSWGAFHWFAPAFHKRRAFRTEQEVRAVLLWPSFQDLASAASGPGAWGDVAGMAVSVDLSQLVQGIVISPGASRWLTGLVESVMRRYGLPRVPIASEVAAAPEW